MLKIKKKAYVRCNGGSASINCIYGCMGCGNCEAACKLGAVKVQASGVAVVDPEKCVGCGLCVKACPQEIIALRREDAPFVVRCSNPTTGPEVMKCCGNSCITCGNCGKNCPADAIDLSNNYPIIDGDKCLSCGFCLVSCPRKVIVDARGIIRS